MNFINRSWCLTASLLASSVSVVLAEDNLPDAATVMQKVVERAEDVARTGEANNYIYERRSVKEELDATGRAIKTDEEVFEVIPIQGIPFSRLIKIQNRGLTTEEIEAQNRKEQEFRQRVTGKEANRNTRRRAIRLNSALVERYEFNVERREGLQNRQMLVLSFHPKTHHNPEKTVEDKILNRREGTVWVDEKEAEVAQLHVSPAETLGIGWLGMIASIRQFDLTIERQRLPDGVWVNKEQTM